MSEEDDGPPSQRRDGVTESGTSEETDEVAPAEEREAQREPRYGRHQKQSEVAEPSQTGDDANGGDNRRAE
jgi:hypothetical protein